jgi:IS30 family transposase
LSAAEREEISWGVAASDSCRAITSRLGRAPSTVSRELARNSGRCRYRAQRADAAAYRRAARPKASKLAVEPRLHAIVEAKLTLRWSPEQIAGWLQVTYPNDPTMRISHGQLIDTIPIHQRPAEADGREVPGHREVDLVLGKRPSAVLTLVERTSRSVLLVALPAGWRANQVRPALTTAIGRLPRSLWRSLTWDHGKEMAERTRFTADTGVPVYFCDPRSPWQRASNENTVSVLRGPAGMLGQAGAGNDG